MLHRLGKRWEKFAESFLHRQGLNTQAVNFHCRYGEIDLIMRDAETLVFVEVRFRSQGSFADSIESVDWHKQQRLVKTAHWYLHQHPRFSQWPCRFDVIGIQPAKPGERPRQAQIRWIKQAFEAS